MTGRAMLLQAFPREVIEQALAHRVGDATEIAIGPIDALELAPCGHGRVGGRPLWRRH